MTADARAASPGPGRFDVTPAIEVTDQAPTEPVVVDCDRCAVRGTACGDCIVTVLLGGPPLGVVLDDDEQRAIEVLAGAGLVPRLQMVEPIRAPYVDPT